MKKEKTMNNKKRFSLSAIKEKWAKKMAEEKTIYARRKEERPRIKADLKDYRRKEITLFKDYLKNLSSLWKEEFAALHTGLKENGGFRAIFKKTLWSKMHEISSSFHKKRISKSDAYKHEKYLNYRAKKLYKDDLVAEGLLGRITIPEALHGIIFILPWFVGFCLLTIYPIITTFIYSVSDVAITVNGVKTTFVGFKNYIYAFSTDTAFQTALQNYVIKIVLYVPVITVISLFLALLLNSKVKGTGFFRTIFFLPVIITSGPVIKIFIDQGVASFPGIDKLINFTELATVLPAFLVTALQYLTSEFIMILWFCGIQILVFMTGLQKIDKSVYEAASIDGASSWESFWKVTLPAINPVIVINVVFTVVMQSIFSLNPMIELIQEDMKGTGDGKGYGYASAIAWVYFLVLIVVLVVFVLLFKKHSRKPKEA